MGIHECMNGSPKMLITGINCMISGASTIAIAMTNPQIHWAAIMAIYAGFIIFLNLCCCSVRPNRSEVYVVLA